MTEFITRRKILCSGAVGMLGLGAAVRPAETGSSHSEYFLNIQNALKRSGIGQPTLVLDIQRVRKNAKQVKANLEPGLAWRLVNKSLPCLALLDEIQKISLTNRQMVFSLPYLDLITKERPKTSILMGKPLPITAAASYYERSHSGEFDSRNQLQWLIDTPDRLQQYRDLARARDVEMQINIEIDVGLHRGGVRDEQTMREMVSILNSEPRLRWSGLMGYDAHVAKIPDISGSRNSALMNSKLAYKRMHDHMLNERILENTEGLTLNTGGSLTYREHSSGSGPNEVAVGSAVLKPSDFDTEKLNDLQPAIFIAAPVLKSAQFEMPDGVGWLGAVAQTWDRNQRNGYYIYGGQWLAKPASPEGLSSSTLMGPSSNQQLLVGSGRQQLKIDDFIFMRPTQSEAVIQQFGDIAVYEDGKIIDQWAVFPAFA